MLKWLIIGVIAFAIIAGFLFWKFGPSFQQKQTVKKASTLTVWGLWEDASFMKPALDQYKKLHPDVTINYVYQSSQNYRSRAQTQIQAGQGPDILVVHNTWTPMFLKSQSLAPIPSDVMTSDDFAKTFNPVVVSDFTSNKKIYGMPRGIDGLALYYNEDILKAQGIQPPQYWNEFQDDAIKMTVKDQNGVIQTAGAAMGLTGNVDHWSDILGLLFLQQPGAKLEAPNDANGQAVFKFYTSFVTDKEHKTWDSTMQNSTQAFEQNKLAFYFAPSWRAGELRQANPELHFKIVPVPQISTKKVDWANYWAYAVSSKSQFPEDAWQFVKFLTSSDIEQQLYTQASSTNGRLFGLPYARVDLQSKLVQDPLVGAFITQAPFYKSWYLSSETHDSGINDEMIKYYEDAVNAVSGGADPAGALETAGKGVTQVLNTYVNPATTTTTTTK